MHTNLCPECGASVPQGQTCADAFHAVLSKDFSEAGFREVHHLMVPSYTLQHPSRLSRQGWLEMRKMLVLFVIDGLTPVQAQKRLRLALDSGTRDFSFRTGERISLQVAWSMTVADIRSDDAESYREDVKAWAARVIEDTRDVQVTKNPWLDISLADYEGHMALPQVGQAQLLAAVFGSALDKYSPLSVAVLGCAGGNGFERISSAVTKRVVGVDINPGYVAELRMRFRDRVAELELFVGDVQTEEFAFDPVELVFAGLVFEYVDADAVLSGIRSMLRPGATLLTVVQLPSDSIGAVTPSQFTSLSALSSAMHLVAPAELERLARTHGYEETDAYLVESVGAKQFQVQAFRLATPAGRR